MEIARDLAGRERVLPQGVPPANYADSGCVLRVSTWRSPRRRRERRRCWLPASGAGAWQIAGQLVNFFAGTSTDDTLLLGFGIEQIAAPADRTKLVKQALSGLGVR